MKVSHRGYLSLWIPKALYPGVKWPGREPDHSPPSSVDISHLQ